MRPFLLRWSIPLTLVVLLLPACSDGGGEAADATLAPTTSEVKATTTTVDLAMATLLVDAFADGWNSDDPDAIVDVFAEVFYFKGLTPYEAERTDAASMLSYVEALVPLHIRMERTSELTTAPSGKLTFTAVVEGEMPPGLIWMELEIEGDKITYLKTVEEPG